MKNEVYPPIPVQQTLKGKLVIYGVYTIVFILGVITSGAIIKLAGW